MSGILSGIFPSSGSTSSKLSDGQIAALAGIAGLGGNTQVTAVAIALAESGGDATAVHNNANGSTDYGLWQINSVHGIDPKTLLTPAGNAKAMLSVSNHGANWSAWSTYNNRRYIGFMPRAIFAVQDVQRQGGNGNYLVNHPIPGQGQGNPFDTNFPGVNKTVGSAVSSAEAVANFLGKLSSTAIWIRIAEVAGGLVLLVLALVFGARSMGVSVPV